MVDPPRALANLAALERKGALGPYGFRDALDYTRPDPGRRYAVVGNYMAHHVGMSLVALTNALAAQVWQERFHADPLVRSAELLLHERIPRRLVLQKAQETRADEALPTPEVESPAVREFDRADTPRPHVALLGRAPYTVMVSHCGAGYSRYEDLAVTRWRADGTSDSTGQFCYVKDVTRGRTWSVAHQPVCAPAEWYRALLATDRVTFHRSDGGIETRTEIAVVPEDAAEVRCVTVTNHAAEPREIELTSYGEVVLGPADADRAHPAFANLFVETEWHEWCSAITATRRPRSAARAVPLVRARRGHRRRAGGAGQLRDRPRPLPRPRLHPPRPGRAHRGRPPLRYHRSGARPDLRAADPRAPGARPVGVGGVHHPRGHHPRARLRAREPLPRPSLGPAGPRPRVDLPAGGAARARRDPGGRRRLPGAGRLRPLPARGAPRARRRSCAGTAARSRSSGRTASRATGRSCWRRSTPPRGCRRCGSSSRPTTTGGVAG